MKRYLVIANFTASGRSEIIPGLEINFPMKREGSSMSPSFRGTAPFLHL